MKLMHLNIYTLIHGHIVLACIYMHRSYICLTYVVALIN
jgi:hypothetical protein